MLGSHIKKQHSFFHYVPFLKRQQATTIASTIYLHSHIFADLTSQHPSFESRAILLHEETHLKRIKKLGLVKYGFSYLFIPSFRFHEELSANKVAFHYLKENGRSVDLERKAKILSSWVYLWPVSYKVTLRKLSEAWDDC